jgi:competence protein ComEC
VRVLAPSGEVIDDDPNASSLVLRIDHGDTSILLTGDAERESEETMVSRWDDWLDVDIVKVAHHGSRTSSTSFFVERTNPEFAIVSAGFNSYGLPSHEVMDRWERRGARVHLTRTLGAFCLSSYGTSFRTGC